MPLQKFRFLFIFLIFALLSVNQSILAQSTAFSYQGRLSDSGNPANGQYDLQFKLFDTATVGTGTQQGSTVTVSNVNVSNGSFSVSLDFGACPTCFDGSPRFLEIAVKPTSGSTYTTLTPRQPINSSPYALRSLNATTADGLSVACVNCITSSQIQNVQGSQVTGTVAVANGGTGSSVKNFVDLTTDQTIGGNKTFSGNISAAALTGNGAGLTNLNGANIATQSITSVQIDPGSLPNTTAFKLLGSLRWDLLKPQADFFVGGSTSALAFDGANIWVANFTGNNVTKLRASDGTNIGTFPVGAGPIALAFDGSNIWVANQNSNNVMKLRGSDGVVLATIGMGDGQLPAALAFDGANIWVANSGGSNVVKLRVSDGFRQGPYPTFTGPVNLAFDGTYIWIVNRNNEHLRRLRASDGTLMGDFHLDFDCYGIVFDGVSIWVSNTSTNTITKLRAHDGFLQGTFTVSADPRGIAFDGVNIWVASNVGNSVTKLRASDGAILAITSVVGAGRIAFDGANMWVTTGGDVVRLAPAFPQ